MSRFDRPFKKGDEKSINHLYELITGTKRSEEEYAWEWLHTWDGPGSIWLEFDDSRASDDQLIGQYSLIPTPMSLWGESVQGAKTENCMSHPDFRGKGNYFFHEQKYFAEAREKYEIFFTTTGNVARGAPGKLRKKLGYKPFGVWVTLSLWLDKSKLRDEIRGKLPNRVRDLPIIPSILSHFMAFIVFYLTRPQKLKYEYGFQKYSDRDAPFESFHKLWENSKHEYGISIDRTQKYLQWRFRDNPYLDHQYITIEDDHRLVGYLVFILQDQTCHIVDIIVLQGEAKYMDALLQKLIVDQKDQGLSQIKMYSGWKNHNLLKALNRAGFRDFGKGLRKDREKPEPLDVELFVYMSERLQKDNRVWDEENWYITDLFKEGRPYLARPRE